ncbi:MAG TPA: D-alanyl-D-alanine carboxypeptidase family protein, partial [Rhabdaerophilum sp.]|nr:D-alanyl-D-alanine carboxypeptidase family protein [Rhabdaerophilum sp.]
MRIVGVGSARWVHLAQVSLSLLLLTLVTLALTIPDAEARRRRHAAGGGYNPPYASIVYDVNSGKTLQATNADAPRHPASVTKVMTLYMLFEQLETGRLKLTSELPVSREAASQAPSKLGLRPGETIQVEDAIKALVTKSANDVAVVVAEAIGGDEERFGRMMTRKAHQLGMRRSNFANASGLPNPRQVTTARDLVTLGKAIHDRFPSYYKYFSTRVFSYDGRAHRNHNRLLGKVEGVDGIKTGYTRASGFNLLTSVKADGRHLLTVVLGGKSARARDIQVASLVEDNM